MQEHVLVVGGASGGAATARLLAAMGVSVIIADIQETAGRQMAASLSGLGRGDHHFEAVDVTSADSVAAMMERIHKRVGWLNHMISVVGGAAGSEWRGLADCPLEDLERTTRLNLLSHQYLLRYAKPLFLACPNPNRSFVMMGSINALRGYDLPAYSAAKAGMLGLMYGAAREYTQDHGIRINIVAPGTMISERTAKHPRNVKVLMQHSLLGETPTHEEVAEAVLMFTHRLPHCTQQMLVIDSGQTAFGPPHNNLYT